MKMLDELEKNVNKAVKDFILDVAKYPLSYYKEKSLQMKLSSLLMEEELCSTPVLSNMGIEIIKEMQLTGVEKMRMEELYSIRPLQLEYRAKDMDGKKRRYDIAILPIKEIKNSNMPFRDEENFIKPLIGIEIGTENVAWSRVVEHFENDYAKLINAHNGIIINIIRNVNVVNENENENERYSDLIKDMQKCSKNASNRIVYIGMIVNIKNLKLHILKNDHEFEKFDLLKFDSAQFERTIDRILTIK